MLDHDDGRRPRAMRRSPRGCPNPPSDLTDPDLFADGPPHDVYAPPARRGAAVLARTHGEHAGRRGILVSHPARRRGLGRPPTDPLLLGGWRIRDGGGTLIEDLPAGFAAGVLFNMQDDPRHRHLRRLRHAVGQPETASAGSRPSSPTGAPPCWTEALDRGRCDFLIDVAAELPLQAIASLLGVPQEDRHFLLDWADATLDFDDHNPGETSRTVAGGGRGDVGVLHPTPRGEALVPDR